MMNANTSQEVANFLRPFLIRTPPNGIKIEDLKIRLKESGLGDFDENVIKNAISACRDQDWLQLILLIRKNYINHSRLGNPIPSESQLEKFARDNNLFINRSAVRRAISYLKEAGEIRSASNKRNVVNRNFRDTLRFEKRLMPLSRQLENSVINIEAEKDFVGHDILERLQCKRTDQIIYFTSHRTVTEEDKQLTVVLSQHYFYNKNMKNVDDFIKHAEESNSVSEAFRSQDIYWERLTTGITSRLPTSKETEELQIGTYDPVLVTTGVNVDSYDKQPIEVTVSVFPAHRWDMIFRFDIRNDIIQERRALTPMSRNRYDHY